MNRIKKDSWVDEVNIKDIKFIGRKTMDYSMFLHGTFIPDRYRKVFMENLSKEITLGESVPIKITVDGIDFGGKIDMPNAKNRKTPAIRFLYSSKAIKELLKDKLEISYQYIMNYLDENDKKPSKIPEEYQEFIDVYKGDEKDTFILKLLPKGKEEEEIDLIDNEYEDEGLESDVIIEDEVVYTEVKNISDEIDYIHQYIATKGFHYSKELIQNFYVSLKTKPFVILSGISGTGKSKIVELFAEAVGATFKNERFKLVPVKPEWSDATDLLGYRNIEGKFTPGIITSIAYEAMKKPELPFFICLDEMNLARVEYYFSDILSIMETRRIDEDGNIISEKILSKEQFGRDERSKDSYGDVYIPQNLYIVGTVNMDETTFPFSKKVLDRANTIEFNKVNLSYNFDDAEKEKMEQRSYKNDFLVSKYLKLSECKAEKVIATKVINELIDINRILEEYNQHFGFRVRDEIVFYMIYATKDKLMDYNKAFDNCVLQKILPKINGSNGDVQEILIKIFNYLNNTKFENEGYIEDAMLKEIFKAAKDSSFINSSEKLANMIRRFAQDGFTTFWQ